MRNKKKIYPMIIFLTGCLFLFYGIHRDEHLMVEQKSNMICLECIGIG